MKNWILAISAVLTLLAGALAVYLLVPSKPEYSWLAFGPEATLRVLVRLDGNRLQGHKATIDPGGSHEFTAWAGRGMFTHRYYEVKGCRLDDPDGETSYAINVLGRFDDDPQNPYLYACVHVEGSLDYRQYCCVELASSPDDAKEAHFDGPLTVELTPRAPWTLRRGDEPRNLRVNIGTINEEKGSWVVVTAELGDESAFPAGVCPVVDVEFPAKGEGPAIKRRYALDKPC